MKMIRTHGVAGTFREHRACACPLGMRNPKEARKSFPQILLPLYFFRQTRGSRFIVVFRLSNVASSERVGPSVNDGKYAPQHRGETHATSILFE